MNPVLGPNYPPYPRFLPMSDAYSRRLRKLVFHAFYKLCNSPVAAKHFLTAVSMSEGAIKEGTYAYVSGPTYETPAEGRFLRNAGADVVGMSTIPEVIVAREEAMEVCVISLVTNFVVIPEGYRSVREEVEAEVSLHTYVPPLSTTARYLLLTIRQLAGKPLPLVQEVTVSHEEVLEVGRRKAELMRELIETVVPTV